MRNPVAIVLFATLAACASIKQVDQNSISVPQATAQIIGAGARSPSARAKHCLSGSALSPAIPAS